MKRTLSLLLALAMVLLCAAALADAQFPLTTEPVIFKVMARTPSFYPNQDFGSVANMQAYEEMTGIHMEYENVDPSVFTNTLAASIASEEYPDIIFRGNITNSQSYNWGEDGILMNIAPYIEEYMPNFNALMEQYPDIRLSITAPDGAIYGLPQVVLAPEMRVPDKMYVNTKMLELTGKAMPTNLDELYDLLVAIRDCDMNGNGVADEVPLVSSTGFLYGYFYGTFGLGTRGTQHHAVVDVDPETNEIRIFAQSENYRKMLEYLRKLYSEKLIYQEIFTDGNKSVAAMTAEERLGVIMDTTIFNVPAEFQNDWTGLKWQIEGPDGYHLVANCRSNLHTEGNFCLTTACKNPELALQWVDYFYGAEGGLFFLVGREGINWEREADGTGHWTAECAATRTPDMTQDGFIAQFAMWPGGRCPAVFNSGMWGGEYEPVPAETALSIIQYVPETVWPIFSWSEEENEVISTYQNDIKTYITNSTAQVIAGEIELTDEWWNTFVSQIDAMGGDKLISAYKSAVERIYAGGAF